MATSDAEPVGADIPSPPIGTTPVAPGRSSGRRTVGIVGQYLVLTLLSVVVLGPLVLTVIQALSPPFEYIGAGKPLHPVHVRWLDRTWFSGGAVSVIARTFVIGFLLAWLQKVGAGLTWKDREGLTRPSRLVAIVGGTLVLGISTGPVFQSLYTADGKTAVTFAVSVLAVSATQVWGYIEGPRRPPMAVFLALLTGFGVVSFAILMAGPAVWTITWTKYDLAGAMGRSLTMTVCITVLQVVTATLAAYAFVFLRFPFKRILFALFMGTLLLPVEVTLVGNVAFIRQLEWTNTMQALVLPFGASALGTFLIRQGFRGLPSEIQDATRLDGYGHLAFLTKFAVPLTRPVVASFTVIAALTAWNQYLWPRTVIEKNQFNTLQIQLRAISASEVASSNQAIAAALVAAVPVVILLIAFQRQIIRGLTAGAVK